ncbi:MAG: transcription-repair coupling factor, partial [Verrucomicrobiia bacterium]
MNSLGSALLPSKARAFERLIGVGSEALCPILEQWTFSEETPLLVIVARNSKLAEQWTADLIFFAQQANRPNTQIDFIHFPETDASTGDLAARFESGSDRIAALDAISRGDKTQKRVILTTPAALSQSTPDREAMSQRQIVLRSNDNYGFTKFTSDLEALDYDNEGLCEAPGQFAKRGGLIDVYPITSDKPYRIDFFGDEIDSIKELDPVTQRSGESISSITIDASPRLELAESPNGIIDYLPNAMSWAIVEPDELLETFDTAPETDGERPMGIFWKRLIDSRSKCADSWTTLSDLDLDTEDEEVSTTTYEAESLAFYRSYPDETKFADERLADEQAARIRFLEQVREWESNGEQIVFILPNK